MVKIRGIARFSAIVWLIALSVAAGEMTYGTSPRVAAYFERAKKNEATRIAFLHKMPKGGDLHNHTYGAIEAETLIKTAIDKGLFFDRATKSFVATPPVGSTDVFSPQDMLATAAWAEVLDAIGMRSLERSGENGHDHFFRAFDRFILAIPANADILRGIFVRAVHQRINRLELMDVPNSRAWIAEAEEVRREVVASFAEEGLLWDLDVAYIYSIDRSLPLEQFRAELERAAALAVDPAMNIVSITLLNIEDDRTSQEDFKEQMKAIDALWRRYDLAHRADPANPPPPKFTLHAGELTTEFAAYDSLRGRISASIAFGHASRIGHGTSIMWEDDVYGILNYMRKTGVAVEICPTSSEVILGVSGGNRHPFRLYWDAGVPVVIGTDDEGLARSNMTLEYSKIADWFDLRYGELKWLAFNSLEYSLLPGDSFFIGGDYNNPRPDGLELMAVSRKAEMQCALLNAFAEYEARMENMLDAYDW